MKKIFSVLLLFISFTMYSQIPVKIANHTIQVEDTLMKETLKKYEYYMESNPINYEKYIRDFDSIVTEERDRYFVSEFKDGKIILNKRLNDFPNTKRVTILHHLAINNGMKENKHSNPHVSSSQFSITDKNEGMFEKQIKNNTPYNYIVTKLEEESPLKSKLR